MKTVAITGPESTGKTSLAASMADKHQCVWVPEYAREYLDTKGIHYNKEDVLSIFYGQKMRMDFAQKANTPFVFFDTDMLVLKIWYEFKFKESHTAIDKAWKSQKIDFYFLCDVDIPWKEDPLREHPNQREELLELYKINLEMEKRPYILLRGNLDKRIKTMESILSLCS